MNKIYRVLGAGMFLIMSMNTQANIKQNIEQQGFVFVKQIPAPQGMTGWVGHEDQYSNTVFISNDDKYYMSNKLVSAARGWAQSYGYKVNIKPNKQIATRAADYHCR